MNNLVKILSSALNSMVRVIKVQRYGKDDIQTCNEIMPAGFDSSPIKDMVALYAPTNEKGETNIVGYINKNQKAKPGEVRMYSTDASGSELFYTWLKDDGTCELGGDADNLVRYLKLDQGVQKMAQDINTELGKIAAGIATAGGAYTVVPIVPNISAAKINEIKTL